MKKLLFALFGLLVITSCSKEHEPLPTPQVSIEAPAGTDPTQPIALTLGGTLTLKAVSANTDEATYLWEVNNEQVGQAQEYTFTATELGNYIVNVTVFNAEGTGNTVGCEVTVYGPYRNIFVNRRVVDVHHFVVGRFVRFGAFDPDHVPARHLNAFAWPLAVYRKQRVFIVYCVDYQGI